MAIGAQFAGLDMKNLIGGPLSAAAESSVTLAQSTADFINRVGFNEDKSTRTVMFKFQKSDSDALGNPLRSEMQMEVPILAIVPIPNLQIDEVNILFDMEVRECEKSESSLDAGGSFSGSANFGIVKVSVSGSVSSHSSNTRSTDNSAKYHVDVKAANHGTPEGLSRVLDIMAASAAPILLSSKMVDGDGQEVDSTAKEKRAALQLSYEKQQKLGTACRAASDEYEAALKGLQDSISSRNKAEKLKIQTKLNGLTDSDADAENRIKYTTLMQNLNTIWERVSQDVRQTVEAVYDSTESNMLTLFEMKKVKDTDPLDIEPVTENDITTLKGFFTKAITNYTEFKTQETALTTERSEYNALLMKR
jgi:hypothetical protein